MPSNRVRAKIATTAVTIIPVVEPMRCSFEVLTADGGYTVLHPRSRLAPTRAGLLVTAGQASGTSDRWAGIRMPDTARVTAEVQFFSSPSSADWRALPRAMKVGAHRPT